MNIKSRLRRTNDQYNRWYLDITDLTTTLFEDSIEKIEISLYHYEDDMKIAIEEATQYIKQLKTSIKRKEINFDGKNIIITFKNKKQIKIYNSEWGTISLPSPDEMK